MVTLTSSLNNSQLQKMMPIQPFCYSAAVFRSVSCVLASVPLVHRFSVCVHTLLSQHSLLIPYCAAMISRTALFHKVLPAVAAVCCLSALAFTPRSAVQLAAASEPEQQLFLSLWTSNVERGDRRLEEQDESSRLRGEEEEEEEAGRRALRTIGVPGEGLLLAVANSDEDAVDEFGHEEHFSSTWHKDLFPVNRYASLAPCTFFLAARFSLQGHMKGAPVRLAWWPVCRKESCLYSSQLHGRNCNLYFSLLCQIVVHVFIDLIIVRSPIIDREKKTFRNT